MITYQNIKCFGVYLWVTFDHPLNSTVKVVIKNNTTKFLADYFRFNLILINLNTSIKKSKPLDLDF